ncbi:MAG: hypothetical protein AAB864_01445 [Patescibacteria group bacterium]
MYSIDWSVVRGVREETEAFLKEIAQVAESLRPIRGARFHIRKRERLTSRHEGVERWAIYITLPDFLDMPVRLRMYRLNLQRWNWVVAGYGSLDVPPADPRFPDRFQGRRCYFDVGKRPPTTSLQRRFYDIRFLGHGQKPPYRRDNDGAWPLS